MNWVVIESIAAIFGAIGVITSLIYVGFQVQQNTRAMHAHSIESTINSSNFVREQIIVNEEVASLYIRGAKDPDSLSELERTRFRILLQSILWTSWNAYAQTRYTGIDESIFEAQLPFIRRVVITKGGQWVWQTYKEEFEVSFREVIEEIIA